MASAVDNMLHVLCGFLSVTVIIASLVLKIPQISMIFKGKSCKGLSTYSVFLELCGYSIMLTYHCAMSYPISTYLEYNLLVPQDVILLLLVLYFKGNLTPFVWPSLILYVFVCYLLAFRHVPEIVSKTIIGLVTPLSMSSKLLQIGTLLKTKDAGTVSATTWALAMYSTLARSITTLVQTGDILVLVNFTISFVLNFTMTALIILYQPKTKKD